MATANQTQSIAATTTIETDSKMTSTQSTTTATVPFPWKVHEMLECCEKDGLDHIVSWLPTENGFKVHDSKAFVAIVLPKFFRQSKYKSFQRQCNIWGFERLLVGPNKGGYTHVDFIRGQTNLCSRMKRQKIKGAKGSNGNTGTINQISRQSAFSSVVAPQSSATRSVSVASYSGNSSSSSSDDSVANATRSISPMPSKSVPFVDGRNYNSPELSSTKIISSESLMTLENNIYVPELIHTVPVSPGPDQQTLTSPQTGDSIDFEGQNFFFIHDEEFAATTPYNGYSPAQQEPKHERRLSLDLFAAATLEKNEELMQMLTNADTTPTTAEFSLTSSSYFY